MEALTRDAIVRDFCRKKALVIVLHNAAGGGGGAARVELLRPLISCNCGQLSHTAANRTSHTCERQKRENSSAAGCSLFGGESCLQLPNRAAQPPAALSSAAASSPNQPMQTRCRSTVRVGAARRGGDLWSFFHEPTFAPLRHQKGLSVRAGSQRAKESPLLCPPEGRETRRW